MNKKIKPIGKQLFKLEYYELGAKMIVEIDFDMKCEKEGEISTVYEYIVDMVKFWSSWKYRVEVSNKGCFISTFLKQLMVEACRVGIIYDWNLLGIQDYFNEDTPEGYYPLDSVGINIIEWYSAELDDDDIILTNKID